MNHITICVRLIPSNPCFLNKRICMQNNMLLRDVTAKIWSLSWFDFFDITQWTLSRSYSNIVFVTLKATKPITLVDGKEYFLCHIWLLLSLIYLLFQINALLSNVSLLWLKFLYSLQNVSRVSCDSFSVDPEKKYL